MSLLNAKQRVNNCSIWSRQEIFFFLMQNQATMRFPFLCCSKWFPVLPRQHGSPIFHFLYIRGQSKSFPELLNANHSLLMAAPLCFQPEGKLRLNVGPNFVRLIAYIYIYQMPFWFLNTAVAFKS